MRPVRPAVRGTEKQSSQQPINEQIRYPQIQVISSQGANLGVLSRAEALAQAQHEQLDLVLIAEQGNEGVPVAKIMDFGKALYAKKKKQAEAKKNQKTIQVKELKFRPKIGAHDFEIRMAQALEFLKEGKHVKFTLQFRGREIATSEDRGNELFQRIDQFLQENGLPNVMSEKDARSGAVWSKLYYLKPGK